MDFELRQAREKLEREQRDRMQRAKAKAERERRAKAEAARRREALEASHRERRLDAARAQEEADQKMEEVMQLGKGVSFSHMFEALRYDGPGDKIKLPPSSFKELSDEGALDKGPMYFRLSKVRDIIPGATTEQDTEEATCCGVLEFTAREGSAELPLHVWNNLFRSDTPDVPLIEVKYVSLPKGTYAKLKPEGAGFSDLPNHRAVLETALRNHATLSENDIVVVNYGQLQYKLKVLELKPASSVSVLETDVEVDIEGSDSVLDNEENQHVLVPLTTGKVESSVVEEGKFRYYKFSVEESASEKVASGHANIEVKIDTDASGGDTDIYVSRHPLVFPTQHRHEWSSHEMGSKVLMLKPRDSSLVSGVYSIGVYGFKGTSKYQLSVAIKDVSGQRIGEHASASGSVDVDSVLCKNCKRHIASRSAHLHEAYCMRHNVACPHDGCGVVLRKEEAADHVHCNKCGRAFQQREMEKHMKVFHEPLQCPCGVVLEKEDMVQHQSSTCPLRLIVCRFCGDTVHAGGEPVDARDRLRNMCEHESICGSRTAPCADAMPSPTASPARRRRREGAAGLWCASVLLALTALAAGAAAQASPSDVAAMRAVAKALGADKTLGWDIAGDPCSPKWDRVSCESGRVTAIQVGGRGLTGTLAPEVRDLTALTRLEVFGNFLSGPLPSLAGEGPSSLQVLLARDCNFTSIPADFFKGLTSLQTVDIDHNPFALWTLPDDLAACTSLTSFSANKANISGTLPDFFGALPGLEQLSLAFNQLSGPVPPSLANAPLVQLWLNNQDNGAAFNGSLSFITNMTSLQQLWLQSNAFTGPLPDFTRLGSLRDLQLRDNKLTGPVPDSLVKLKTLQKLTLTNNLLQGPMPQFSVAQLDMIPTSERFCSQKPGEPCDPRVSLLLEVAAGFMYPEAFANGWNGNNPCNGFTGITCNPAGNITVLNFPRMGLSGSISPAIGKIGSLEKLILSNNNITGTVPEEVAALPKLTEVDLSNNNLYGKLPTFTAKGAVVKTGGNPNIGKDAPAPTAGSGGTSNNSPSGGGGSGSSGNNGGSSSSSAGVIAGSVVGAIAGLGIVAALGFYYYKRKQKPFGRVQSPHAMVIHPRHSGSDDMVKITVAGGSVNGGARASETYSQASSGPRDIHVVESGNMVISIQVLRNVTNNFSEDNILGRGGFGTVYKGELHDGTKIAVKRMEAGVMGNKGLNEFKSEIAVLTKVRHRNLVSLLGYCLDGNERILVYEYMPQGALSEHLFEWSQNNLRPLEWKKRLSIALDVARGVEYLHSLAQQTFIHRDLKPSNILLGDDMKAKVADFGLVRLAPADGKCVSVETRLAGTFGYLAPEYAVTGRVTTKADVFSFGVILMELITGRKALDETQPEDSMHLVTWFRRMQLNKDTFRKAIDPVIDLDEETFASVSTVSELAGHCCAREPHQRPDMGHAVNVLSTLSDVWKPTDPDSDDSYGIDLDMTLPQALKKWQAFEDSSHFDGATSSFVASLDNTQTSIPTRPPGFAESFTSADGR